MTDKRVLAGPVMVLVVIAVACTLATKDTPPVASIPPRVLEAQIQAGTTQSTAVRVRAQDPDGTIVGLRVRLPGGRVSTQSFPCAKGDFGGRTITHTFTLPGDPADVRGAQVQAVAESCFGAQPRHSGPWADVTTAG